MSSKSDLLHNSISTKQKGRRKQKIFNSPGSKEISAKIDTFINIQYRFVYMAHSSGYRDAETNSMEFHPPRNRAKNEQ